MCPSPADFSFEGYLSSNSLFPSLKVPSFWPLPLMPRWPQQTSLASSLLPFFPVLILPKFIPVNLLCCCCCSRGSFFFFFLRFFSSFILWKLILKWMVHSQWDNIKDLTVISHSHKSELLLIQEHKVSVARAKQGETLDISWGSLGGLFLYKTYFLAHSIGKVSNKWGMHVTIPVWASELWNTSILYPAY